MGPLCSVYLDDSCSWLSDSGADSAVRVWCVRAASGVSLRVKGRRMDSSSSWPGLSGHSSSGVRWCSGSRRLGSAPWASSRWMLAARPLRRRCAKVVVPFCVGLVDWRSGCDELVDGIQPLVVGGEYQRPDPALQGEPGQRPAGDIPGGGSHLQAMDPGSRGHQDVHLFGHAEHGCVVQRGAAGHAAGIGAESPRCRPRSRSTPGATSASPQLAAVISGVSLSPGRPFTGAPLDERFGDGAGAGQVARQPQPVVVEAQYRHVSERLAVLVVAPMSMVVASSGCSASSLVSRGRSRPLRTARRSTSSLSLAQLADRTRGPAPAGPTTG